MLGAKASNQLIFALDIGTRNVVGLVAEQQGEELNIIAAEIVEHETRAMLDGQIHDIGQVAKVVKQLRTNLEAQIGKKLQKAAVAVAGRALRTRRGKASREISPSQEITEQDIQSLEWSAIQNALNDLDKEVNKADQLNYYCVGYNAMFYELDGARIGNLLGHYGSSMSVEVLVTFLPSVVVDSMLAVLRKCNLKVHSITLEPIAAINIVVPPDMRKLNLLLIDVGAGTTDMALTKEGTVVAYAMVPVAGDEITEKICEKYLLDFQTGEMVKRALQSQETVSFEDILGFKHDLRTEDIIKELDEVVDEFAKQVARQTLELNLKAPHAIICIGGGSQTPKFTEKLGDKVGLSKQRIAVRGHEILRNAKDHTGKLLGPESVTPVGIAISAINHTGFNFINVFVNDKVVRMLSMGQNFTVLNALAASGIDIKKLYGRPGMALTVEVAGELKIIRGGVGQMAELRINGKPATLDTIVRDSDRIFVGQAQNGENGKGFVKDVIPRIREVKFLVNSQEFTFIPTIRMNGEKVNLNDRLIDRAKLELIEDFSLQSVLLAAGFSERDLSEKQKELHVWVNGNDKVLVQKPYILRVNGGEVPLTYPIESGDEIEFIPKEVIQLKVKDAVGNVKLGRNITVYVNDQAIEMECEGMLLVNGKTALLSDPLNDGDEITLVEGKEAILTDIFKYLPVEQDKIRLTRSTIFVDGQKASFLTPLRHGSRVDIAFEEMTS